MIIIDVADGIADAIQQAVLAFTGGKISDDTVLLVLTVPPGRAGQATRARGAWHATRPQLRVPAGTTARRRSRIPSAD